MKIIGRKAEQDILNQCLASARPEFLAVYGRRRIGKTFLIREFFHNRFSFYASGVPELKTKGQLKVFHESLRQYGSEDSTPPEHWLEGRPFSRRKLGFHHPARHRRRSVSVIVRMKPTV